MTISPEFDPHVSLGWSWRRSMCVSGTPERGRRGPNGAELSDPGRIGGIPKDSRSRHPRRDLFGRSFESRSRKLKIHCREKRTSGLTVLSD